MSTPDLLLPSVITSSSVLTLPELYRQLVLGHGPVCLDLMVLRPEDASRFGLLPETPEGDVPADQGERITDLVADHYDRVLKGFTDELHRCRAFGGVLHVSALATYFPEVACMDDGRRAKAQTAVVNCVRLCHDLTRVVRGWGWIVQPCVEIVGGSLLEPGGDDEKGGKWVNQYKRPAKVQQLVGSLVAIKEALAKERITDYALALELEPGDAYVLNGPGALVQLFDAIDSQDGLNKVVGLNFDIAHFRIARHEAVRQGASPDVFSKKWLDQKGFIDRIVHAHIADHPPGMHTRDQALGTFTDVERFPCRFSEYIDILTMRAEAYRPGPGALLFTGAVALELEGCSRIGWVHNSIPHLKRLLAAKK